jgi:hypothetical protein
MSRGIDHLVLAVRDLEFACSVYERLGFNLTPQAQHPFGTGNRLAQLQNDFLEIVSVTKPEDVVPFTDGVFSFGAYNQEYLKHRDGMSMIALKSDGWENDRKTFSKAGFDLPAPFTFSRLARQPDGKDVTVGFDLTFIPDTDFPEAIFFTCSHQHELQYFYKKEFQNHPNTALAVSDIVLLSVDLEKAATFFRKLYGTQNVSELDGGFIVETGQARFSILDEKRLNERFAGHQPVPPNGCAAFVGYQILVSDLAVTRDTLNTNTIEFNDKGSSLWVTAFGSVIEFSQGIIGESVS